MMFLKNSSRSITGRMEVLFFILLLLMTAADAVIGDSKGSMVQKVALLGKEAQLPCDTSSPVSGDRLLLTIWFKEGSKRPFYSVDFRQEEPRSWASASIGSRAQYIPDANPPYLQIYPVHDTDEGVYKCRVDYRKTPTQMVGANLSVIVPPGLPTILEEDGSKVEDTLGPYDEGSNITVTCQVTGGQPSPSVIWLQGDRILDDDVESRNITTVRNVLTLGPLSHEFLHSSYKCQTGNSELVDPISRTVVLDVNVKPMSVAILGPRQPLVSGLQHNVTCESEGSRPPALISWWLDDRELPEEQTYKVDDGNATRSTLAFTPGDDDGGAILKCEANSPVLIHTPLKDEWELDIHYLPVVSVELAAEVDPEDVREGDNVTFICRVRANPAVIRVKWYHKGLQVQTNKTGGVIVSRTKLKLYDVESHQAGLYTCLASNTLGDGQSKPLVLKVKYAPVCSYSREQVIGAAKEDTVNLTCRVNASPGNVSFRWYFRSPDSLFNISKDLFSVQDRTSLLTHRVQADTDYGYVLCFAANDLGEQASPCSFSVIPAGKPDALENCTLTNQTTDTLFATCLAGDDGGLRQQFVVQVFDFDDKTRSILHNSTETEEPSFTIEGLHPGASYVLAMYSENTKGRSEERILHGFTLPLPQNVHPSIPSTHIFPITPILGVLIGVVGALVLVAILVVVVMKLRGDARRARGRPEGGHKVPHAPLQHSKDGEDGPDVIFCRTAEPTYEDVDGIPQKLKHANIYETVPYDSKEKNAKISENSDKDDVEYAELTFNNGKSKQKKSSTSGANGTVRSDATIYATIDHARTAQHQQQQERKQQQQVKQPRQQAQGKKTGKQTAGEADPATQRDLDQIPLMDAALESSV